MRLRRRIPALIAAILCSIALTTPTAAHARAQYCGITWGSLAKSANTSQVSALTDVRAGRHACFDRLVLDYAGDSKGYRVAYVSTLRSPGSGEAVPVRGGARLAVVAPVAYGEDEPGVATTYRPRNRSELVNVSGWQTFRQVRLAAIYEGEVTIGVGVRARLPFRAFTLDGPGDGSRLVIDVAHRW